MPHQPISCGTFLEILTTTFASGSKAPMAFMMPPKAATHSIITMTHAPASVKPVMMTTRKKVLTSVVPAMRPSTRELRMPASMHSSVWQPVKLRMMMTKSGITM